MKRFKTSNSKKFKGCIIGGIIVSVIILILGMTGQWGFPCVREIAIIICVLLIGVFGIGASCYITAHD